ncbi:MAG: cupin domain-containing protein [Arenicellales bacterium]
MSTRTKAIPTILIDNEKTIVTEWRFPVGAETGWHRHALDYVVVPLTSGTLLLETRTEVNKAELTVGKPYFRELGVEHNVVNDNEHEFVFVETEFK